MRPRPPSIEHPGNSAMHPVPNSVLKLGCTQKSLFRRSTPGKETDSQALIEEVRCRPLHALVIFMQLLGSFPPALEGSCQAAVEKPLQAGAGFECTPFLPARHRLPLPEGCSQAAVQKVVQRPVGDVPPLLGILPMPRSVWSDCCPCH